MNFIAILSVNDDLEFTSTINGIEFRVTVSNLALIFGVRSAGFADYNSRTWPFLPDVDNATISRTLSDQPFPHAQIFAVSFHLPSSSSPVA